MKGFYLLVPLLLMLVLMGLVLSCGGGGSSSSPPLQLNIRLVNATPRNKTFVSEEEIPFIIFTDQVDREDPKEADAVIAYLVATSGNHIGEVMQDISRGPEQPYPIIPKSRNLLLADLVPGKDYSLEVRLGKDLGVHDINREEIIFYSGKINGIEVTNSQVLLNGQVITSIDVPIGLHLSADAKSYTIQGYCDYASTPFIGLATSTLDISEDPVSSFLTAENSVISYSVINQRIGLTKTDSPSEFFELSEIDITTKGLLANSTSGLPDFQCITGYISRNEILAGNPLVLDFETTFVSAMALWLGGAEFDTVEATAFEEKYRLVKSAYDRIHAFSRAAIDRNGEALRLVSGDIILLKLYYRIAEVCEQGRADYLISRQHLSTRVVNRGSVNVEEGVNHFLMRNGRSWTFVSADERPFTQAEPFFGSEDYFLDFVGRDYDPLIATAIYLNSFAIEESIDSGNTLSGNTN